MKRRWKLILSKGRNVKLRFHGEPDVETAIACDIEIEMDDSWCDIKEEML